MFEDLLMTNVVLSKLNGQKFQQMGKQKCPKKKKNKKSKTVATRNSIRTTAYVPIFPNDSPFWNALATKKQQKIHKIRLVFFLIKKNLTQMPAKMIALSESKTFKKIKITTQPKPIHANMQPKDIIYIDLT